MRFHERLPFCRPLRSSYTTFRTLPHVPVPPLAEQQRIVGVLDEAFEGIAKAKANTKRNLANTDAVRRAIVGEQFAQLVHAGSVLTLGDVCSFENGDRGKNYPSKEHRVAEGVPFINAGHLAEDGINFSEMDYISPERFELLSNGKIQPQDILFCLRGSLGKFASVGTLRQGAIASSLVILRPRERLRHEFLLAYLGSSQCAEQIAKYKGGAAQPNLGARDLARFELPVPPLPAQVGYAARLLTAAEQTRALRTLYKRKLAALDELKRSLLHHAFTGAL